MADESSEGRRFSYKKKQPKNKQIQEREKRLETIERNGREREAIRQQTQGNRKRPAPRVRERAKRPTRDERAATEELERRKERDQDRRYEMDMADRERGSRMEGAPRRRPPGGPTPMIQPQVGPVGQLRSQAAHTYGYTPEAYKELRKTPIEFRPPENEAEAQLGGSYESRPLLPDRGRIFVNSDNGGMAEGVATLGHEQAHAAYNQLGNRNFFVSPGYQEEFDSWRGQGPNVASQSEDDFNADYGTGIYGDIYDPNERFARTVEFSPNTDRSNWPDSIRPYYSGFLQGMDRLSTGARTPQPPTVYNPLRWR